MDSTQRRYDAIPEGWQALCIEGRRYGIRDEVIVVPPSQQFQVPAVRVRQVASLYALHFPDGRMLASAGFVLPPLVDVVDGLIERCAVPEEAAFWRQDERPEHPSVVVGGDNAIDDADAFLRGRSSCPRHAVI